jgi:hypothetical protein
MKKFEIAGFGAAVDALPVCLGGCQDGAVDSGAPSDGTDHELKSAQRSTASSVESTCLV